MVSLRHKYKELKYLFFVFAPCSFVAKIYIPGLRIYFTSCQDFGKIKKSHMSVQAVQELKSDSL